MAKRKKKAGLPPGSVIFTGSQKVEKVFIHYLQYDAENLKLATSDNQSKIVFHPSTDETVDWYDLKGLHDTILIESLGKTFNIHPLILEDIADINQRPKFEEYEEGIFITLRALAFDQNTLKVKTEQVALYFRKGLLISFQEDETDLFEAVRHRINNSRGKIRQKGTDYLAYALMDNVVDHYYIILEQVENAIENIEEALLEAPDNTIKERIHHLKKELLVVKKSIAPLREAISQFSKSDNEIIEEHSTFYIRDLYDHTIQIMDMVETYRDMLNGLQDLYLSEISFKMNQVMQVLAVVTTVFVPLSFLAGLYGMNFDHIPELHYKNGYFVLLGVMFLIFIGSLVYFKRKRWF